MYSISRCNPTHFQILLMVACTSLFWGCRQSGSNDPSAPAANSSYKQVLDTKQIRVAYISYPPSFAKDPNTGEYSGIFHDVLAEMADRLDLDVYYSEETAWGTMLESVNNGRVHMVCAGIWPNASRAKHADFTEPIYFSPIYAYVKSGNSQFDGDLAQADAGNVKIAVIDGEMSSIIASKDYPSADLHEMPQTTDVSQLLLEITTQKADLTFVEPAIANKFLEKNPNSIARVKGVKPVRVFPNVMLVAKGEHNFLWVRSALCASAVGNHAAGTCIRSLTAGFDANHCL